MKFCPQCGKLLTPTEIGYKCMCGVITDKNGFQIDSFEARKKQNESEKLKKRKGYRFKYTNLGDDEGHPDKAYSNEDEPDDKYKWL